MHYRKACTLDALSLQKTFASLTIFINFVSPYAESATPMAWVGVGQDIIKGVYYALVLTS